MTFPRGLLLWTSALLFSLPLRAVNYRMEASTTWAENINRASSPADWRDALRLEAHGAAGLLRQWTAGLVTTAELNAGFERVPRYTGLDAFTAGARGQARQKFGLGPFAPVLAFDASLQGRESKRPGDDGWTADAALRLTKRVTSAWRVGVVGDWQQHYADSSVFDTRHQRLFGTIAWDITPWLQLSHGNGRLWGDFTANASPSVWSRALSGALGAHVAGYYTTVPWAPLPTFGPGWVTYRVSGHVSFWWLELSPAIGRNTSLPLRYESLFSVNKIGVKYRQDLFTLQLLHRF